MKLKFAGATSTYALNPSNFLFNCRRNRNCQPTFFVPVRSVKDLFFYVDLPGKPALTGAVIVNACCQTSDDLPGEFNSDFGDDFAIGGEATGLCSEAIVFDRYVVGQTPNLSWYGVFQTTNDFVGYKRFFFRFTFTVGEDEFVFYSEMYELDPCAPLLCLRACYPNEPTGTDAWDCNGIYYGYHAGVKERPLGDPSLRYFHTACVRHGQIIDTTAKLTLNVFNSKLTYKATLLREQTLEFELVPAFYKDVLLAIFQRGTVEVDGRRYNLQVEQNWKVLDFHAKLWQLDTLLYEECKQYFGCTPPECVPLSVDLPCVNNIARGNWFVVKSFFTQEFTGNLAGGDAIQWELLDKNGILVESGEIVQAPLSFTVINRNPERDCFTLRWRIKCLTGFSDWKDETFGNCNPPEPVPAPTGTLTLFSYGGGTKPPKQSNQCSAQGATEFWLRFSQPLVQAITLRLAAYYFADNGSNSYAAIGGEIIPPNHPEKARFARGNQTAFAVTIPAGTTEYMTGLVQIGYDQLISFPVCNSRWGANARHRIYYTVEAPAGAKVTLTPAYTAPQPYNTVAGGILELAQIL